MTVQNLSVLLRYGYLILGSPFSCQAEGFCKPKQPFLEWLHAADPTRCELSLPDLVREPTIYLIPECDTDEEAADILHKLCEEIFEEQLAGWYRDTSTWPRNRSYEVFCHWFDYRHHSMLVDLCDEPLIYD